MSRVYLIPTVIAAEALHTIPGYVLETVRTCEVIFAENERTVRRYLKALDRNIDINSFTWYSIDQVEAEQVHHFREAMASGKNIAIISESGCPGIADPGQILVAEAQQKNIPVIPLVGPNSLLLALMASGLNGQQFEFVGYLPVDAAARNKRIRELEAGSAKNNSTKLFIETPYRNNALLESLLQQLQPSTRLCIAINITATDERIITRTVADWKKQKPELPKQPAIFLLLAGN